VEVVKIAIRKVTKNGNSTASEMSKGEENRVVGEDDGRKGYCI
jgi:hypothetical protein